MDNAIKHHLNKSIISREQLTGGYTFSTWLLTLSDNQKVVFRHQYDFDDNSGGKILIADILNREKFFYDNVNRNIGRVCPEVYVVDGTKEYFEHSFCIMEYIEGVNLNDCFNDYDFSMQNKIRYQIGKIAAQINSIQINNNHPYIIQRGKWEDYIANKLRDRFIPLINCDVISKDEADIITGRMLHKKASKTLSYLHLDMRRINMIFRDGQIYIIDAENCEFGDPLRELAVIDCGNELDDILLDGYKSVYGDINIDDELFYFYKMERMALVLHVFMNVVKTETELTRMYLEIFNSLKKKLTE